MIGDENIKIKGVMTIDEAREGYITFVSNIKYLKKIEETAASAILVSPGIDGQRQKPVGYKKPLPCVCKGR